jgi:hypothetical protein
VKQRKYFYTVVLKLDSRNNRGCYCKPCDQNDTEYIQHISAGWYRIGVFAFDEESALNKAKQVLADYKKIKVQDFFENTVVPEFWSLDTFAVCPECHREYKGLQMAALASEYYVCPSCRRRCSFEESPDRARSKSFTKFISEIF